MPRDLPFGRVKLNADSAYLNAAVSQPRVHSHCDFSSPKSFTPPTRDWLRSIGNLTVRTLLPWNMDLIICAFRLSRLHL